MNKKTLKRKCDILWSKIIRNYGACEKCGKSGGRLEAAHIRSRVRLNLRYDLENGLCLCHACHRWAHQNPVDFTWWLEKYLGREVLEELHEKDVPTYGKFDYEDTHKYLKDIASHL